MNPSMLPLTIPNQFKPRKSNMTETRTKTPRRRRMRFQVFSLSVIPEAVNPAEEWSSVKKSVKDLMTEDEC